MTTSIRPIVERSLLKQHGLLPPGPLRSLRDYCARLLDAPTTPDAVLMYYGADAGHRLMRAERFVANCRQETGIDVVALAAPLAAEVLRADVVLFKDKINFRHPGVGGYGAHQDAAAGWDAYAPVFCSVGIFLEPSAPATGGFEFTTEGFHGKALPNVDGRIADACFEGLRPFALTAEAGDAIAFDSYIPHRSFRNESERCIPHVLLTFNPRRYGDHRKASYESKVAALGVAPDRLQFRLFDFDRQGEN
jgi:hypothetical protein